MKTIYSDLNIKFNIEHIDFSVLNIVFERFLRSIPKHSHGSNSYEIHFIPYGKGTLIMDGVTYKVHPNTLYITGPHVEHEQIPDTLNPMSEYCIYLNLKKVTRKNAKDESSNIAFIFENTKSWFGQDTQEIYPLMQMIFYELENEYTGYMTQIETLLQQLVVKIVRNYESKKESKKHFGPSDLVDSKYIIAEECFLYDYRSITLKELSEKLGLSTRQTERFLRDCYGKTFRQKKEEARMSVAALLLMDKDLSITHVADNLGYSSIEHFATAFKKYYHMTAGQYRKILLMKHI